ncbi:MAG: STAS domain-containing protein [Planctomycetota bacterium]
MAAITELRQGAVVVLRPEAPLVQDDAGAFSTRATEVAGPAMGRVVIDLSTAPYIDSAGLESLLDLSDLLETKGQTLRLCDVSGTVRDVLDLTALLPRFEYFADTNTAVRSFL